MGETKKTDWGLTESVSQRDEATSGELVSTQNQVRLQDSLEVKPESETPEGILAQFQQKRLTRKASLAAMKMRYDQELDALQHRLSKACMVEKARADQMAEEFLKGLDAQHLQVLGELGLKNKETREEVLLKLTESTVERLKEVQNKDWPQSLIEDTINELFKLRKRSVAEIMKEIGS